MALGDLQAQSKIQKVYYLGFINSQKGGCQHSKKGSQSQIKLRIGSGSYIWRLRIIGVIIPELGQSKNIRFEKVRILKKIMHCLLETEMYILLQRILQKSFS